MKLCDIGGGIGLYSIGCAGYGFKRAVLADDFNDPVNHEVGDSILDLHRGYGVEVVSNDASGRALRETQMMDGGN